MAFHLVVETEEIPVTIGEHVFLMRPMGFEEQMAVAADLKVTSGNVKALLDALAERHIKGIHKATEHVSTAIRDTTAIRKSLSQISSYQGVLILITAALECGELTEDQQKNFESSSRGMQILAAGKGSLATDTTPAVAEGVSSDVKQ